MVLSSADQQPEPWVVIEGVAADADGAVLTELKTL